MHICSASRLYSRNKLNVSFAAIVVSRREPVHADGARLPVVRVMVMVMVNTVRVRARVRVRVRVRVRMERAFQSLGLKP